MPAAELRPEGLVIRVRVTPNASADRVEGIDGDMLRVRLRALPSEGAANAALLAFLAKVLGLPKSGLRLVSGARGRAKTVVATGDAEGLRAALERLNAPAAAG